MVEWIEDILGQKSVVDLEEGKRTIVKLFTRNEEIRKEKLLSGILLNLNRVG